MPAQYRAGAQEGPAEVHVEAAPPAIGVDVVLPDVAGWSHHTGVIDQQRDRSQLPLHVGHDPLQLLLVGDVDSEGNSQVSLPLDQRHGLVELLLGAGEYRHVGSGSGQGAGDLTADASTASGDDGDAGGFSSAHGYLRC